MKAALIKIWGASGDYDFIFEEKVRRLIRDSYSKKEWTFKF